MSRRRLLAIWLLCALVFAAILAVRDAAGQTARPGPIFRSGTELVLVNVVVRDRNGAPVRGLSASDFTVTEDGRPQQIQSFDLEELSSTGALAPAAQPVVAPILTPSGNAAPAAQREVDLRGHRLVVLFFDLSSMQEPEFNRAIDSARSYVAAKVSTADLVAIASFSTSLQVLQDFTADRDRLLAALDRMDGTASDGLAGTVGSADAAPDTGNAFTADDTEYNIFTNDRRLMALQTVADALGQIDQKKSLIYFSSGLTQSDQDNQVQLRRTVNAAVRANLSIYAPDMRGLQAVVPGGAASQGSVGGQSAYSGASVLGQFSDLAASQDTLGEDTGGRAFLDSNRFDDVFDRVIADTSAYYVLGYASTNPARDGRFRRIEVRVTGTGRKVEFRRGYYAARDFTHSTRTDREAALQEQLLTDISATDLSSYAAASWFRTSPNRFLVSLAVVVPGNQLPFGARTSTNASSIDILGVVEDAGKRPVARIRDTLHVDASHDDFKKRLVQYGTSVELEPGRYRFKVVLRENQDGTFGSYEMPIIVPQFGPDLIKMSSVVVGTQLQPGPQGGAPIHSSSTGAASSRT